MSERKIFIIGTRGVPAAHGGFETFAHRLSLYLVARGWSVTVYCQTDDGPTGPVVDEWQGVRRVSFRAGSGALGTMKFDLKCIGHAIKERGVMLVLGYNTAAFSAALRLAGNPVYTNMDGIEWKRAKWPWHGKIWLYINEWIGALTSTALIADHPEIANHLSSRRSRNAIEMIPYGAEAVGQADESKIRPWGLVANSYVISIGRIEPENNIIELVAAYSKSSRSFDFVCLGKLDPQNNEYHRKVLEAASPGVKFLGAIYDPEIVSSLRFHARAYCHGHSVGGTNPSLVEAMGAGNAIIAHNNKYNRWVAGDDQFYFDDVEDCGRVFNVIESDPDLLLRAKSAAKARFLEAFQWPPILERYENLMSRGASNRAKH